MSCLELAYIEEEQPVLRCVWKSEEHQKTDVNWYDYGARFYDPSLGRWHAIDNKAEKYFSFTPYNYTANNPVLFVDYDGNDYGVYVKGNNITITATYYVKAGNKNALASANRATSTWNKKSGQFKYVSGKGENAKEYSVTFNLKVKAVDDPAGEFMNDRYSFVSNENKNTPDQSSNVYEQTESSKLDNSNTSGQCDSNNYVKVAGDKEEVDENAGAHEIGHTLNLDDSSQSGLMYEGSGENSTDVKTWDVSNILKRTSESNAKINEELPKGKVKRENKK